MADIFEKFLPCSWRGITFPTSSVDTEVSHDMAIHKKMDRDGANIEPTGRNPTVHTVRALFINTIMRSAAENTSEALFPNVYNKFLAAIEDRSAGDFVHPFHGKRRCHAIKVSESFNAQNRGGPSVTVQFIETDEGKDAVLLASTSALTSLNTAAIDLDTYVTQLNPSPYTGLDELGFQSFEDFATQVSSAIGSVEMFQNKIASKINGVTNAVDKMVNNIDRAATLLTTDPLTNITSATQKMGASFVKIVNASNRFKAALFEIQGKPFAITKLTKSYLVPGNSTLKAIASRTRNKLSDLLMLNPAYIGTLIIPRGASITYYDRS